MRLLFVYLKCVSTKLSVTIHLTHHRVRDMTNKWRRCNARDDNAGYNICFVFRQHTNLATFIETKNKKTKKIYEYNKLWSVGRQCNDNRLTAKHCNQGNPVSACNEKIAAKNNKATIPPVNYYRVHVIDFIIFIIILLWHRPATSEIYL